MWGKIKAWVEKNWVWLVLFLTGLVALLLWFIENGKGKPPLVVPGQAEIDAELEKRRIRREQREADKKAKDEEVRAIEQANKEESLGTKKVNDLNDASEEKVGEKFDKMF